MLRYIKTVLFLFAVNAFANPTDVSGRWTGSTICPLGSVDFTIDLKGNTGTFSHGGYGPNKVHPVHFPVEISTENLWQGVWVNFQKAGSGNTETGGWDRFSGLLSQNGRALTVSGVAIGDCRKFMLSRSQIPRTQPSSGPSEQEEIVETIEKITSKEPTKSEMVGAMMRKFYSRGGELAEMTGVRVKEIMKAGRCEYLESNSYRCPYRVYYHVDCRKNPVVCTSIVISGGDGRRNTGIFKLSGGRWDFLGPDN